MAFLRRFLRVPLEAIRYRSEHRKTLRTIPPLSDAISHLAERAGLPAAGAAESPVFVLSAGWRSGSTLLQRLVMSARNVLIWGEPYDHCCYVQHLAETLQALGGDWPPDRFFLSAREETGRTDHASEWIANLYPDLADLQASHKAFFDRLLADPARVRGYERWGLKEVRLSAEHAVYLKWLYPNAKFLFLIRNPFAAYKSYRIFRNWYDRWPLTPILTPGHYGRHWARIAASFVETHAELDARLIRFEDLVGGRTDISQLSAYLDLELDPEILGRRVTGRGEVKPPNIPRIEGWMLRRAVDGVARELGYGYAESGS